MKYITAVGFSILCVYGIYLAVTAENTASLFIGIALSIVSFATAIAAIVEPIWRQRRKDRK